MLRLFCDCCWFALLGGGLMLTMFSPFSEPRNIRDVTLQRLDRLATLAEKPRKLVVTDRTVFVLDGETVTGEVFLEAKGVVLIEIHVDDDGKTLRKLVGVTKEE